MVLSGVSQAQFSSTWTAVSDYDYRGWSQSREGPGTAGQCGLRIRRKRIFDGHLGFERRLRCGNDGDIELDVYAELRRQDQRYVCDGRLA